jgi:hypothetical protein
MSCSSKRLDGLGLLGQIGDLISTGVIEAIGGFSTGGVTFRYNEGPMTLTLGSGGVSDISVAFQNSYYSQIGNMVTANFIVQIAVTNVVSPGELTLSGFPNGGVGLSFGGCELLQTTSPSIVPDVNIPVQAVMVNGVMNFVRVQDSVPIELDVGMDGALLVGCITYPYDIPPP